jgi:hypothetical protein
MSCLIYSRIQPSSISVGVWTTTVKILVQKVVEGYFCVGPVEKNSCRIHVTCYPFKFSHLCVSLFCLVLAKADLPMLTLLGRPSLEGLVLGSYFC